MSTVEDKVQLEQLIADIVDNEVAVQKLVKYLRRLRNQVKREAFYRDLDRRMEKVASGKARFIPLEEVWEKLGMRNASQ